MSLTDLILKFRLLSLKLISERFVTGRTVEIEYHHSCSRPGEPKSSQTRRALGVGWPLGSFPPPPTARTRCSQERFPSQFRISSYKLKNRGGETACRQDKSHLGTKARSSIRSTSALFTIATATGSETSRVSRRSSTI